MKKTEFVKFLNKLANGMISEINGQKYPGLKRTGLNISNKFESGGIPKSPKR